MPPLKLTKLLVLSFALGAVLSIASDAAITPPSSAARGSSGSSGRYKDCYCCGGEVERVGAGWSRSGGERVLEIISVKSL